MPVLLLRYITNLLLMCAEFHVFITHDIPHFFPIIFYATLSYLTIHDEASLLYN